MHAAQEPTAPQQQVYLSAADDAPAAGTLAAADAPADTAAPASPNDWRQLLHGGLDDADTAAAAPSTGNAAAHMADSAGVYDEGAAIQHVGATAAAQGEPGGGPAHAGGRQGWGMQPVEWHEPAVGAFGQEIAAAGSDDVAGGACHVLLEAETCLFVARELLHGVNGALLSWQLAVAGQNTRERGACMLSDFSC